MANSVDPDQTAPIGAVCSGSTLFASILKSSVMLGNYLQQTTSADDIFRCIFFLALKGLKLKNQLKMTNIYLSEKCRKDTSQGNRAVNVPSPWGYRRKTFGYLYDFMNIAWKSCGNLAGSLRLSHEPSIIFRPKYYLKSGIVLTTSV